MTTSFSVFSCRVRQFLRENPESVMQQPVIIIGMSITSVLKYSLKSITAYLNILRGKITQTY
jgi:hypothetical protein